MTDAILEQAAKNVGLRYGDDYKDGHGHGALPRNQASIYGKGYKNDYKPFTKTEGSVNTNTSQNSKRTEFMQWVWDSID